MECRSCGSANREGANFCSECGSKLEALCTGCGNALPNSANFCDHCGKEVSGSDSSGNPAHKTHLPQVQHPTPEPEERLPKKIVLPEVAEKPDLANTLPKDSGDISGNTPTPPAMPQATQPPPTPRFGQENIDVAAEHRQLTVLFCDLVGSTALSERFDAEDMRHILASYQETARNIVDRYAGLVARYIGDGILIYFGYPVAYEDSAVRALNAALEIAAEVPKLSAKNGLLNIDLQIRIGINTGSVVVGDIGSGGLREQQAAVGEII